jgi:hypothetical protein
MQAMQYTGSSEDYVIFEENFKIKRNKNGDISKTRHPKSRLL